MSAYLSFSPSTVTSCARNAASSALACATAGALSTLTSEPASSPSASVVWCAATVFTPTKPTPDLKASR